MIRGTKLKVQDWITQQLNLESAGLLWTDTEKADLSDELARKYRPGKGTFQVRVDQEMGDKGLRPVYVVVRGELEIHTDDNEDRAKVVARVMQHLDSTVADQS